VISLVKPCQKLLQSYTEAIEEGSFCNMALGGFADDPVATIRQDGDAYIRKINDPAPRAVKTQNGSEFSLTDHELLWITDGRRFIGTVSLRYAGDSEILDEYGGHVGLAIRPALLNRGFGVKAAQQAWKLAGKLVSEKGLARIRVSCSPANTASKRLIEHNGGKLIRRDEDVHGTGPNLLYEIVLQ
jgi:predicted acetyltransferase